MHRPRHPLSALLILGLCMAPLLAAAQAGERLAPLLDDLGDLHYPIATDAPMAQRFFDQGLILSYAFNHAEAARSFREAIRLDPECAMCHWGLA